MSREVRKNGAGPVDWTWRIWFLPWVLVALAVGYGAVGSSAFPVVFCLVALGGVPLLKRPLEYRRWRAWSVVAVCSAWWVLVATSRAGAGFYDLTRIGGWALAMLGCLQILSLGRGGSVALVSWSALGAIVSFAIGGHASGFVFVGLQVALVVETLRRPSARGDIWISMRRWAVVVAVAGGAVALQQRHSGYWNLGGNGRWTESVRRIKGFSPVSRLGTFGSDYLAERDDVVALRVWADSSPGILKGMVHELYSQGNWIAVHQSPAKDPERMAMDFAQFCRDSSDAAPPRAWAVGSDERIPVLFAPVGTGCVGTVADSLMVSASGVFRAPAEGLARGWTWFGRDRIDTVVSVADLRVPRELEGLLDTVLTEIGGDSADRSMSTSSQTEFVSTLQTRFFDDFHYSLDVPQTPGVDPLRSFFRARRGYCEYFATAAALLLRRRGVPARYVTGLSEPERGPGGWWIYRQGGAHAWVEWKPVDGNWRVWDPTPATPERSRSRSLFGGFSEFFAGSAGRTWHAIRDGDWRAGLEDWTSSQDDSSFWRWGGAIGALVAGVGVVGWTLRRRRAADRNCELAQVAALERAEAYLRRQGSVRFSGETVGSFLERLPPGSDAKSIAALKSYQTSRWKRPSGQLNRE